MLPLQHSDRSLGLHTALYRSTTYRFGKRRIERNWHTPTRYQRKNEKGEQLLLKSAIFLLNAQNILRQIAGMLSGLVGVTAPS